MKVAVRIVVSVPDRWDREQVSKALVSGIMEGLKKSVVTFRNQGPLKTGERVVCTVSPLASEGLAESQQIDFELFRRKMKLLSGPLGDGYAVKDLATCYGVHPDTIKRWLRPFSKLRLTKRTVLIPPEAIAEFNKSKSTNAAPTDKIKPSKRKR